MKTAFKYMLVVLSGSLSLNFAIAQDSNSSQEGRSAEVREELNQEIDSLYPKVREARKQPAETPMTVKIKKSTVVEAKSNARNNRNNNGSNRKTRSNSDRNLVVQAQPATVVEEAPLAPKARANSVRKQRLNIEQNTENKIVEHLEDDRIKAEKERSNRVLKNLNGNSDSNKKARANTPAVPQVVVVPVQSAPAAAPTVEQGPSASVENTSTAKLEESEDSQKEESSRIFVGLLAGVGNYPTVQNVRGVYAAGVTGGVIFPERIILEGTLGYSSYDIQNVVSTYYTPVPTITEMNVLSLMAAVKYQILASRITPVVGGAFSYDRRTFKDRQYYFSSQTSTSQSFDAGLIAGADVNLNKTFTVGLDFRYMFNLTYRRDQALDPGFAYAGSQAGTPIESASYYVLSLVGKVNF